jgi:hypothetical protein
LVIVQLPTFQSPLSLPPRLPTAPPSNIVLNSPPSESGHRTRDTCTSGNERDTQPQGSKSTALRDRHYPHEWNDRSVAQHRHHLSHSPLKSKASQLFELLTASGQPASQSGSIFLFSKAVQLSYTVYALVGEQQKHSSTKPQEHIALPVTKYY